MAKLILDTPIDIDFKLIGLNANLEPFKLAFLINQKLHLAFRRKEEDITLIHQGYKINFALYSYCDPKTECVLYFIQNKSKYIDQKPKFVASLFENEQEVMGKFLIESHKQCDYFIKIEDESKRFKTKKLSMQLNEIPQIVSAYEIATETLKSPENLTFE
ncbi:IPExxxVDY family protein [Mesohalobacter halotolerans]|uniref:IPExxxVDY family protein n=1 Tax=Mesohalobacter halotolerans TaxID=1883405 RepID=A0A4U5TS23_9FLAO|nr:IPExxxVDY family protein [Mesohalobacter halotolerans]MBS3738582.1 IPExxxVDY family protein [Psychroflexus sp.]TKS57079.1 IPExxxVDY family protein [Mesohalobacter halotolerans]